MLQLTKSIVFIGMPGSGKTTIAKSFANKLSREFYDLDDEIKISSSLSIADFFLKYNEQAFRLYEVKILRRLLTLKKVIIAIGGGTYQGNTIKLINDNSYCIWLCPTREENIKRILRRKNNKKSKYQRPLFNHGQVDKIYDRLFKERKKFFKQAHIKINAGFDKETTIDDILQLLLQNNIIIEK